MTSVERQTSGSALGCASREADHHAVGIDEAVGGTEAAAENVVGAKLRDAGDDVVAGDHVRLRQAERVLQGLIGLEVVEVFLCGGDEEIALWAVASGLA